MGAPANTTSVNDAGLLAMKFRFHAPIAALPAILIPIAEPIAAMAIVQPTPSNPILLIRNSFLDNVAYMCTSFSAVASEKGE